MSFNFLPLPIFVLLALSSVCICFYYAIKQWNKERKGIIALCLTVGGGALAVTVIKVLEATTNVSAATSNFIGCIIVSSLILMIVELSYLLAKSDIDAKTKKWFLITFIGIFIFCALLGIFIYVFI